MRTLDKGLTDPYLEAGSIVRSLHSSLKKTIFLPIGISRWAKNGSLCSPCLRGEKYGFTLLEVMVSMAIIAIALTAVLGSQSQSVSFATEAKFSTTASLLAQAKMAEVEARNPEDLYSESGDFGEDFPGYAWEVTVEDVFFSEPENVSNHLIQINVIVYWGEEELYQYPLRRYRFFPQEE
jgi:general secretion pathway protein I